MSNLTYAQLEAVWLQAAQGTRYATQQWAALMAAIAEAESGGDPSSTNPTDNNGTQTSWGLWQISNGDHTQPAANWNNPIVNAQLAIGKLDSQGLGAWGTYDSGAYKAYISGSTTPDPSGIDATLTSSAAGAGATTAANAQADCAWRIGSLGGGLTAGALSAAGLGWAAGGGTCLLSKSQVRGMAGVGLMITGTLIGLNGLILVVIAAGLPMATRIAPAVAPVRVARGLIGLSASGARKPPPKPTPAKTPTPVNTGQSPSGSTPPPAAPVTNRPPARRGPAAGPRPVARTGGRTQQGSGKPAPRRTGGRTQQAARRGP